MWEQFGYSNALLMICDHPVEFQYARRIRRSEAHMINPPARETQPAPSAKSALEARIRIRALEPGDAGRVAELAASLSAFEGAPPPPFHAEDVVRWGTGPDRRFDGMVAERDGRVVGYLLHHSGFHVGHGGPGLVLMDLFVESRARGYGVGRALMAALAQEAQARSCRWITWQVHPENASAMDFYRAVGGRRYRAADFELGLAAIAALAERD
jgi:GNAT superfamily N-acetyltransferase